MLEAYRKSLVASISGAVAKGERPTFHSAKFRMKVRITAISGAGELSIEGIRAPIRTKVQLSKLTPAEMAVIATSVARKGSAKDHARTAFFLLLTEKKLEAEEHLQKAGEAGNEVRKAFGQ